MDIKKYKISDFSKLTGMSLKTLKHYEKLKILVPEVDNDNNYRYYNYYHCGRMLRSKCFTNLGFTVKETSHLINNKGIDEIISDLEKQEADISKEIELIRLRQERIKEIKQRYELFREKPNTWLIDCKKACYLIRHVQDGAFVEDEKTWKRINDLINCQPHIIETFYYPKDNIQDNFIAMGIDAKTAESLHIDTSSPMIYIKEEKCFVYVYSSKTESCNLELINKILKIMKNEGYKINGDIIVEGGFDQYPDGERIFQKLIWIPIE